jgi:hypothetical protein
MNEGGIFIGAINLWVPQKIRTKPLAHKPFVFVSGSDRVNKIFSEDDSLLGLTLCCLVEVDRHFRRAYCRHHQGS